MYTIIRFTREPADAALLDTIGQMFNEVRPGAFTGTRAGKGFGCHVSDADSWADHVKAIVATLETAAAIITEARQPGDLEGTNVMCVTCDLELISKLSGAGVQLEVSIYGPPDGL